MAHFGAIDPEIQAMCGWCSIMGREGGRGEMFRHLGHIDLTTSTYITQAVLQALLARERTGKGQKIEMEMLRAAMAIQTTRLAEYLATGVQPRTDGQRRAPGKCRIRPFSARTKDTSRSAWSGRSNGRDFAARLKLPELISDPRFAHQQRARRASRGVDSDSGPAVFDQTRRVVDYRAYARKGAQRSVSQIRGIALPSAGPRQRLSWSNSTRRIGAGFGSDGLPWKFDRHPGGSDSARRDARRAYRGGLR